MAMYSTLEGCKPKLRCRLILMTDELCWMSPCGQMIWIRAMDQVSQSCDNYDLTMSKKKKKKKKKKQEVVHQPALENITMEPLLL